MKPKKKKTAKKKHKMWALKSVKTGKITFVSEHISAAILSLFDNIEYIKVVITEEDWK